MSHDRGGAPVGEQGPHEAPGPQLGSEASRGTSARVAGGAAADFVAGLGRKVQELAPPLEALRSASGDPIRPREELRRRLHAIGVAARLFHFQALAEAISAGTRAIDEAALRGAALPSSLIAELGTLVEALPRLAWHEGPAPSEFLASARPAVPRMPTSTLPWSVLVIGDETLALALGDDPHTFPCEIERTTDLSTVTELSRALAPDLVVVDADLKGAVDAVALLVDDALSSPVPMIAVGTDLTNDHGGGRQKPAARLVALGVARALDKPYAATTLREACADAVGERSLAIAAPLAAALGTVTPEALAERLVGEVRRLLLEDLEPFSREAQVDLGSGADVLGPMWGALAKVRDVVSHRSHGRIAFRGLRLERPIALGAPLSSSPGDEPMRRADARRDFAVDLEGRIVIVADDDAAVRRFICGALREAGATVVEAEDGDAALAKAREHAADLIVLDVVMPGRDGTSVARALHHDPVLRDRPVILLSWKEDLLRRLRDLRSASAAGLRKDDDAEVIVARVREALSSRVRIEARIAHGAEVRGRLDDLSVASLLTLVSRLRVQSCVVIRDATFVWEVDMEHAAITRLSRTSSSGGFARGIRAALPSLLGVGGGRFLVRALPPRAEPRPDEGGASGDTLEEQLASVVAHLRAATDLFTEQPARAARLELDGAVIEALAVATPPSLHPILDGLGHGSSPAAMLVSGIAPPSVVESVLLDLARRGAITAAFDRHGVDLLAASAAEEPAAQGPSSELLFASLMPPPPEESEEPLSETPGSLTDAVLEVSEPGAARGLRPMIDPRALQLRTRGGAAGVRSSEPPSARAATLGGIGPRTASGRPSAPESAPAAPDAPSDPEPSRDD